MINYGIVIVLFVIVQALSSTGNLSRLLMGLLVPLCVYTIASVSLNLVVGFSGELSLGHAGFMCVGAFSSALFSQVAADSIPQVPRFILAILVGAAVAALFGVIIGIPVLRLRGDYLAIVTLAFGEIIKNLINIATEKKETRYPAQMTLDELKEVLKKSREESKKGLGMTTEELRKRYPLCE